MVSLIDTADEDIKELISHSIYSSTVFSITEKIIIKACPLSDKICALIQNVKDQILIEKSLSIHSISRLIPYLQDKLRIVERVVLDKFYDSQSNTDVSKLYAKELFNIIKDNFTNSTSDHLSRALEVWGSKRLIAIGSIRQHEFLTYFIRQFMLL